MSGGADFLAEVPALIHQLATVLGIPREQLDFSPESLQKIDDKVFRQFGRRKCDMWAN
jgi:hypothetical protein